MSNMAQKLLMISELAKELASMKEMESSVINEDIAQYASYKLCYVAGSSSMYKAWFTSQPLKLQRGDDWNDAPADCNAGTPYGPTVHHYTSGPKLSPDDWNQDGSPKFTLFTIAFEVNGWPSSGAEHYSVDKINSGAAAWLTGENYIISGGMSLLEVINEIEKSDGIVYLPRKGISQSVFPQPVSNPIFVDSKK